MAELTCKELLELKERCKPSKLGGAGEAYTYALKIPSLIDEILDLREEIREIEQLTIST